MGNNVYSAFFREQHPYNFDEIKDYDREVIKQEDRIFGEEDIKKMFDYFERNNFRKNPICEYVFG